MKDPHRPEPERDVLPSHVSDRLLARAAELDAALKGGTELAKLRAAAAEAGISSSAFDAALDEMRGAGQAPAVQSSRRRPRIAALVLGVSALALAGAVTVSRGVGAPTVAMVEQAFLLRCLPPGEAAELMRPVLKRASNAVMFSPVHAPRVLTVRATPEQMGELRALLDRHDDAACQSPATTR